MSSIHAKYEKFCDFMEHNTKGVEIGIYSISGILFAVSYFKIRPITKFGKSSDIPRHFITKKVLQNGVIKSIEPNQATGALLRVDHKPPINLLFTSRKTLPVKIFGVEINSNGYSWLQSVTLNEKIQFLPISKNSSQYAECQVTMLQNPAKHEKPRIDLAEALISLGFARTTSPVAEAKVAPSTKAEIQHYYKKLQKAQSKAQSKRQGLWGTLLPPRPWPIRTIQSSFSKLVHDKVLPAKYRLPELVR